MKRGKFSRSTSSCPLREGERNRRQLTNDALLHLSEQLSGGPVWARKATRRVLVTRRPWSAKRRRIGGANCAGTHIKVLYCFNQHNDDSKCEAVHTSPPIRPWQSALKGDCVCNEGNSGNKTSSVRICRRDGVDNLSGHDVGGGCAPQVSDLPVSTYAFVLGHRHARACAPILSVGSGAHSHDHTGDSTGGRDLGAVPHRLSWRAAREERNLAAGRNVIS